MKRTLAIMLAIVMVLGLVACGKSGDNNPGTGTSTGTELAGTYDITVWVGENAVDLTKKQIEDFNNTNTDGIKFNATVNPQSEATAADQMLVDISAGADIFCFAQDQFARLVQGGALNKLGTKAAETVKAANDPGVVAAATSGDTLYAYPMTSDNGYFMYYDKSVIPEEDLDSLEKLIADCEAANKWFCFEAQSSAWYIAAWFFATGCKSEWKTADDGSFESVLDTFNSRHSSSTVKRSLKRHTMRNLISLHPTSRILPEKNVALHSPFPAAVSVQRRISARFSSVCRASSPSGRHNRSWHRHSAIP